MLSQAHPVCLPPSPLISCMETLGLCTYVSVSCWILGFQNPKWKPLIWGKPLQTNHIRFGHVTYPSPFEVLECLLKGSFVFISSRKIALSLLSLVWASGTRGMYTGWHSDLASRNQRKSSCQRPRFLFSERMIKKLRQKMFTHIYSK